MTVTENVNPSETNVNIDTPKDRPKNPAKSPATKKKRYVMYRQWDNARSNRKNTGVRHTRRQNDCKIAAVKQHKFMHNSCYL